MSRYIRKESSPLTDAMEYYGDEMTREAYIATNYLGEVPDAIPANVEATFPVQFQRETLLRTLPASDRLH